MKNRIWIYAILLVLIIVMSKRSHAQSIGSDAQNGYVPVSSYAGVINQNTFGFRIHLYGKDINVPNWAMALRVNGPIRNSEGKILDPTKLKISINYISPGPTLDQIGTTNAPVPLSQNINYIFKNSRHPLFTASNEDYRQLFFSFNIHVEGGAYLEALKSWQEYIMNVEFQVYNQSGEIVTQSPQFVRFQIQPTGIPPSGPTYSIRVLSGATAGVLEFTKPQDFATGVQAIYPGGLSVISSTPYQLQVRTLTPDFISNSLSIPVNTVGLQLKSASTTKQGTVTLSNTTQTIISNETSTGSQARLYDIRYFTQPNDNRLLKAVPENYQTTLMYTITPQ